MSVFDAPTKEQEDSTSGQEVIDTQESYLAQVVTEKGDHWNDPETLAKGYAHAQKRIKELESREEDFNKHDYAKTLLEQLQNKQATADTTGTATDPTHGVTDVKDNTGLTPEDIDSLLESKLSAREKARKVETALTSKFGSEANRVVHRKASELGLSIDKMQEIAQESPDAFLRLIGEPEDKQLNTSKHTAVNTSGFNSDGAKRDHSYYSKLRRENRKLYDKSHKQMLEDRVKLGDKFYN